MEKRKGKPKKRSRDNLGGCELALGPGKKKDKRWSCGDEAREERRKVSNKLARTLASQTQGPMRAREGDVAGSRRKER